MLSVKNGIRLFHSQPRFILVIQNRFTGLLPTLQNRFFKPQRLLAAKAQVSKRLEGDAQLKRALQVESDLAEQPQMDEMPPELAC